VKLCKKEIRRIEFEKAIAIESKLPSESIDISKLGDKITLDFVYILIERFKNQKKIHKRYVIQILFWILEKLKTYPSLYYVDIPESKHITVCGDTHGQFYDLLHIFEINGLVNHSHLLISE
jgi:serine/threonine-protein phosphatase 5